MRRDIDEVTDRLRPILIFVALLWAVEVVNWALGHELNRVLGLRPREIEGLVGVPAMPFLHGSFGHVFANTVPLLVLGAVSVMVARHRFLMKTLFIIIVSGLAVWVFGAPRTIVVGASGLVFGWFGYLVAAGVLYRSFRALAGAAIALVFYGGLVWGIVPAAANISWEAHLFGAIAGGMAAWWLREPRPALSRR